MSDRTNHPIPGTKAWWRERNRVLRESLPESIRRVKSLAAVERILSHPSWDASQSVLTYVPIGPELDVRPIHQRALAEGKQLIIPRVEGDALGLYRITDPSQELTPQGKFRIPEPNPDVCQRLPSDATVDMAVLPGLAFDVRGGRIGYGKAYFDKLLSAISPRFSIGIAFSNQVTVSLPTHEYDFQMNAVVTEEAIYTAQFSQGALGSVESTHRFGEAIGKALHEATTLLIDGPLGAGKTTCIQGIIKGMGIENTVTSPTFVYDRCYELRKLKHKHFSIHHMDLYRIAPPCYENLSPYEPEPQSLDPDLADILDSDAILLIEWPDRLGLAAPLDAIRIHLSYPSDCTPDIENTRRWELMTVLAAHTSLHHGIQAFK